MMDRSREPRRVSMAASNGLSRRRHRSSSSIFRDSPEDDGPVELHESAGGRLRDRGGLWKKDRDRERDRDRDRDRERERDRDRGERERDRMMMISGSSRSKRRRGERLLVHHHNHHHGGGHHMGGDDSSEESVNEDEDEDEEDGAGAGGSMRMLPPNHNNPSSSSIFPSSTSSFSNHNHHHNHQQNHHGYPHRKSFPLQQPPHPPPVPPTTTAALLGTSSSKVFRSSQLSLLSATVPAATAPPWASDEMIGVSVPRKARSAHTKRSHETWASSGAGAIAGPDQIHRQASASPVRSGGPGVPGILASASASPALAPVSPSSSNASVKKKMKPNGSKQRPPKSSSSKSASSVQDEIEIEIAEVLYGLKRQPQGPTMTPKQESLPAGGDSLKFDSTEATNNKPAGDAKSRVSSPISNSPSTTTVPAQPSSLPNLTMSSSAGAGAGAPMSAIAPKRKRPRPVKYEDENPTAFPVRNSPILSAVKVDLDQPAKVDTCSPNSEKTPGSVTAPVENGGGSYDLPASQATAPSSKEPTMAPMEPELDLKPALTKELEAREAVVGAAKEEPQSPKEYASGVQLDDDCESLKATKSNYTVSEVETQRGEKFQIDLMAPPPVRSSPDRDSEIDFVAAGTKPMVTEVETELKPPAVKDDDKGVAVKLGKEDINLEPEEKRAKVVGEEVESQKPIVNRERHIDLQLDLEKTDRNNASGTKPNQHLHKQQQQLPNTEKSVAAQTSPLPLPMSMAGWPGGLPPMGYMAPLQVVSMEGNTLPSAAIQPPHLPYSQQRPKRCATHCYIARHIHYLQQLSRMNPFWPAATGSALPYATKMNVLPSTELHASRGVNPMQEKGQQGLAIFPGPSGKDKNTPAANTLDPAQRKQILLQQPLPAGAPNNNILHGPTFIFPLSQQAAAASIRPGTVKSPPSAGGASSSSSSSSASIAAAATAVAGATAMSFNYPTMAGNETPYLAILQNGAYPIPIPAHVSTTPAYRGTHPQAMPFFNGSFYSTQMLLPSQLPQQQQPPPPPQSQVQQSQRGHQNPSISSGSSSSQKHLQGQQQKSHGSGVNGGGANLQGFPASKNQSLQFQQRQQLHNHNVPHQARHLEGELGSEDSPSTADSRASRANTNIYGQNFVVPIHTSNFAFMNPAAMAGANGVNGNACEKKQLQPQSQGPKAGVDSLPSQGFAMSFAPINGATAPGFDISSIAQNPGLLQTLPEAARQGYHFMAASAAHAQQQKKSYRVPDDGKAGGNDASNTEEDRKAIGGKAAANAGQSIAFSRPDLTDASVTSMPGNTVIDSSARSLNLGSAAGRTTGSVISPAVGNVNAPGVQQQLQRAQQQQQQMIQLQKQHQPFAVSTPASVRGKTAATSNGSVYSDHISSSPSSVAAKFPGTHSAFPQSIVQSSSSPVQSPQWKNSVRTTLSQVPSSLASNSPAFKNLPQQQSRTQQSHTQISFGANPKSTTTQQNPTSNQSPSSPMVVGSPTTSISKSAGGSPRTTSTSTGNKGGQTSTLSSQQVKNTASLPAQKSSPVGGRNVPSILGHPQTATSSPGSAGKPQLSQQQLSKLSLPHSQMMYPGSYIQSQASHAAISTNAGTAGFYLQRHRGEQQQPQGSSTSSTTGMSSLWPPVTLTNVGTTDPAKAAAAAVAASNVKGGALPYAQFAAAPSSGKPHQLVSTGFPCVHAAVPTAVHVKPGDQKQPAGE